MSNQPPANSVAITRASHDAVFTPNYAPVELLPSRAQGSRLWDDADNMYIDFAGGIAVSAIGHCHPSLQEALQEQAGRFWHVSNLLTHEPAIRLAQRLCQHTFAEQVFLANSGAEANEAALKLARRVAFDRAGEDKNEIIAFSNSFHGRTFFTVSVGGQPQYSDGFGPKPGAITHLPFNDIDAIRAAISARTCAVIIEPVQGEGGVNPANDEFLAELRRLCDANDALLIFDEIQCGAGRSGQLYYYQRLDFAPDILTSAKGLGGGFPIAAMLTTKAIGAHLSVGTHGSTFGGNPLGCAVANALLDELLKPGVLAGVAIRRHQFDAGLAAINERLGVFREIRGAGLLIGCECQGIWQDRARDIVNACQRHGLLVLLAGSNVLRFAPSLIIEEELVDDGLQRLEQALASLA